MDRNVETSAANLNDIRKYWEDASTHPMSEGLRTTARDPHLQYLVETTMEKWIWPGARLLDIGCGDGTSTFFFAKKAAFVHGVDYIPGFVDLARKRAENASANNVEFAHADVMDLAETRTRTGKVDIGVTIRCLINLASWENQLIALREIGRSIRSGGLYLLSEGWSDGWDGLNRLRSRCGLGPMELVKHNCLLDRSRFEVAIRDDFEILHYENLGFYLFMSRVFQPALVAPQPPQHLHEINRQAALMASQGVGVDEFREADYVGVYVLRRK